MTTHKARNKAGREMIERVLRYATRVEKVDINLVTGEQSAQTTISIDLMRRFLEISGRDAELHELAPCEFVYVSAHARGALRCTIRTVAMPE